MRGQVGHRDPDILTIKRLWPRNGEFAIPPITIAGGSGAPRAARMGAGEHATLGSLDSAWQRADRAPVASHGADPYPAAGRIPRTSRLRVLREYRGRNSRRTSGPVVVRHRYPSLLRSFFGGAAAVIWQDRQAPSRARVSHPGYLRLGSCNLF